ncbi:MAG: hypothetical protein ABJN62_07945 [Halioglobus sp.]
MNLYIKKSLCWFVSLAAATILFNTWVDPYNVYRFSSADTQRMSRIGQGMTMRLSKPWQVNQRGAEAAIIGSSRSGSIPPKHKLWLEKRPFNLSMAGLTLYEMLRTIEHAHANGPLSDLVIGLEYETFISSDYKVGIGFSEKRLARKNSIDFYQQGIQDLFSTTLTASTLTRSIETINRRKPINTWYFPEGHWENKSRIWRGESGYVSVGKNMARLIGSDPSVYSENLTTFAAIIEFCQQQRINTKLFVTPEHIFLTGLRKTIAPKSNWREFHQDIKDINQRFANQYKREPFPLWGFGHMVGVVDEPLPKGDIEEGAWFRDGIHFNGKLGVLIMEEVLTSDNDRAFDLGNNSIDSYMNYIDVIQKQFFDDNKMVVERYLKKIL